MKTFSFRFDIDSLADIEAGVPKLIELAKELDVRFTFFVNMGRSFRWSVAGGQWSAKPETKNLEPNSSPITHHSSTVKRLGLWRTFRTVIFNPNIGLSNKKILFKLLDNGHELGLHGGMDHPLWQWGLDTLSKDEINDLLRPAYNHFAELFERPKGFASPGLKYNRHVLELIDEYGFEYASDMEGERPFIHQGFRHLQIPANIIGPNGISLIDQFHRSGLQEAEIVRRCREEVEKKEIGVMFGHPAIEGETLSLRTLLRLIRDSGYKIVPMKEILKLLR